MKIRIRHLEPDDASALQALHGELGVVPSTLQIPYPPSALWIERCQSPSPGNVRLVAVDDDADQAITGLAVLEGNSTKPRRRHAAELAGLSVHPDWHRCGIGRRLMQEITMLTDRWMNIERLSLTVYTDNAAAIALYKAFNFQIEGTHRRYAFRDGCYVDAHTMARLRDA